MTGLKNFAKVGLLALAIAAPAAAPAQAAIGFGISVGPSYGPPPPRFERARDCGPAFYWREGRYAWRDGRYAWIGGDCFRTPARYYTSHWYPGHWDRGPGGGWVWVEGGFR
jgi:hypothetical protein